jgi:hypothetical protein
MDKKSSRIGIGLGKHHDKREAYIGERGLWRAIVFQTIEDYITNAGHEKWKSERLLWGDQKGYFDVMCENAGYDGDWVRRRVKEHEAKGDMVLARRKLKRQPMGHARYILGES